jgi:tetratricopeptide (TPR) repeat protein
MGNVENSNKFVAMKTRALTAIMGIVFFSVLISCTQDEPEIPVEGPRNLDSLIVQHPDSIQLLLERASLRLDEYQYDIAMADAARAFRLDSNNIDARLLYAEAMNNSETRTVQDVATAQNHYKLIIKKQPKNTRALVGLAATYGFQQDFKMTFQYVNEALRIDPKYRDAYVLKGSSYLQLGNLDLAKSSYETAIQQDSEFFEAYFILGQIYQTEDNPVCIEYFTTALGLCPEILEVKYQLAYSKEKYDQLESAQELYRQMVTDTNDFYIARGLFHLGGIKQFVENDIDSAMFFYRSALKTEPMHVESWHNLGLCYEQQGDVTRALQSYAKALKYNPEFELSRERADQLR